MQILNEMLISVEQIRILDYTNQFFGNTREVLREDFIILLFLVGIFTYMQLISSAHPTIRYLKKNNTFFLESNFEVKTRFTNDQKATAEWMKKNIPKDAVIAREFEGRCVFVWRFY